MAAVIDGWITFGRFHRVFVDDDGNLFYQGAFGVLGSHRVMLMATQGVKPWTSENDEPRSTKSENFYIKTKST
jgi:hypothetical protein